ncbi:Cna B-type domain-containing protein, partial [Anaerostipes hadrus]
DDKDNWKFTEDVPQGYQSKDPVWDGVNYVVTFTNVHDNPGRVDINVQKVWEDGSDADGIRVKAIKVTLYQNGEAYGKPIELNASNNWSDNTTFHNLDKYDKAGEEINYEIKEEVFDGLTGDAKTGYMDSYETNETTDADGTTTKNIIITNTHTPETTQKKVKKIWNDNGNKDGIRPKSVSVNLLADGKVEESFTLSSENNWQAKSKLLPVKVNGKKVNYTWEEVKEDLITGESEIGYKPTYDTDANDADLTLITNTHDRTQPKGKVTITKALDPGNLNMDVGDPSFTFTLSGTDVYGKKHSYEKQIKFTKAEVEKQMKDHPGDSIELSVTFDDLEYGTYTCNEGGMLKYFKLNSLTSDSSNATLDQDKGTVTFDIGPAGTTAKAQLEGTAKFINQMIQGSVKLIKKDSNGRVLKDVEFVIQSSDGAEVAKAKTDAAGEVTFDGLIPDTYTITETKTKEGKTLLKEPITITLPLTMSQAEVDKNNVDTNKAIKQGSNYYFYHLTYEVTNDSRLDLPKTGGWIDYLPLAGGMILILGGLFVYYRKKRRKM